MVDREVVRRRLRQIDQRVGALREIARRSHEAFLSDYGLQAACVAIGVGVGVRRVSFRAVQR